MTEVSFCARPYHNVHHTLGVDTGFFLNNPSMAATLGPSQPGLHLNLAAIGLIPW